MKNLTIAVLKFLQALSFRFVPMIGTFTFIGMDFVIVLEILSDI